MSSRLITLLFASLCLAGALRGEVCLECDPTQSRIDIRVNTTVGSFAGRLDAFDSAIRFGDDGQVAAAQVKFHFSDLKTGREKRDRDLQAWQQTELYPEGQFVLTSVTSDKSGHMTATGALMIHGQTHAVSFPFSMITEDIYCAMDGEAVLDTRDYGLPVLRLLGVLKVDPMVRVRFHLQGRRVKKVSLKNKPVTSAEFRFRHPGEVFLYDETTVMGPMGYDPAIPHMMRVGLAPVPMADLLLCYGFQPLPCCLLARV